jgi:hypothetical protein
VEAATYAHLLVTAVEGEDLEAKVMQPSCGWVTKVDAASAHDVNTNRVRASRNTNGGSEYENDALAW